MLNSIEDKKYDVLVVGAGLSGAVIAERFASVKNLKVLVIDKRDHVGGNCHDYVDDNGILMNKYGAHLFHTNDVEVWDYVQNYAEWVRWDHKVLGVVDGKLVNIPVNINTVNALCGTNITDEQEMNLWLSTVQIKYELITNGEEQAKARVGEELYEKIFKNYTYKQWNKYPDELDASILARIPIRNNHDERYFNDKFQALPKLGYSKFISEILNHSNITVKTNVDFLDIKSKVGYETLIYTGPIDSYFSDKGLEKLEYRSIDFIIEKYQDMNFYQQNSVVNYPGKEVPFTRIVEYKHFLNQKSPHTTIVKEITKESGDPYYPVPNEKNKVLYEKYRALAQNETNVYFIGRLANYKYFNMDEAIKNSLNFFKNFI